LPVDLASTSQVAGGHPTGSAFVGGDELRHREEVGRERPLQLPYVSAGREPEFFAKGVEPEPVAVGTVPAGWAGAAVADRAEVVAPLQRRS
jgi:hypothetical protein